MTSAPRFESIARALAALDALAQRKYIRSRRARDQQQADRWLKDPATFARDGLELADWDETDSPALAGVLDAVEFFQGEFLRYTSPNESSLEPAERQELDSTKDFEHWFSSLRSRLADSGISVSNEPRLDRCGMTLEACGVPHIGCVRSLIILCSVVPDGYRVRLIRVAQFVATLYFVQQIDKAAGDWSDADRRIDSGALRGGALAKIDGLWKIAMQLHSKGLP